MRIGGSTPSATSSVQPPASSEAGDGRHQHDQPRHAQLLEDGARVAVPGMELGSEAAQVEGDRRAEHGGCDGRAMRGIDREKQRQQPGAYDGAPGPRDRARAAREQAPAHEQGRRDGKPHEQTAFGRREMLQQQVVEDLHADDAGPHQPALRRQDDATRVRAGTRHRQQRHRGDDHGVEDEGDRVRAEPVADDIVKAQEGDSEHVEAGLDPTGYRIVPRCGGSGRGHRVSA